MQNEVPPKFMMADNQDPGLKNALNSISGLQLELILVTLLRQWRLILTLTIIFLLIAAGILSQIHNRYTAEALLSVDQREAQLLGQNDALASDNMLENQVNTEVEVIGSTSVELAAIDRLALWRDPEFGLTGRSSIDILKNLIGIQTSPPSGPAAMRLNQLTADEQARLVKNLNKAVRITRRGITSIISVAATSRDPAKSALIANSVVDSYLEVQIAAKIDTTKRAANFLKDRVDQIAKSIQDVDTRIDDFIVNQAEAIGTPDAQAELKRLRTQISAITESQTANAAELSQLQSIADNPGSLQGLTVSADLRELAEKRAALAAQLASANSVDLQQQLKQIDQQLVVAAKSRSAILNDEMSKSDQQKAELGKQLQDLFSRQKIPPEIAVNLYRLQREEESDRKLYDSFSTRLAEIQQQVNLQLPNTRIVAAAIVPHDPSFPPTLPILALSALLGLGLGSAAALARDHLVGGFDTPERLERMTGLSILSSVPHYQASNPQNAILDAPFSMFSESIRRMRIGTENAVPQNTSMTIVVTSTEPGEGKSTTALNLARSFALMGRLTVLIDADLRNPSIARLSAQKSPVDLLDLLPRVSENSDLEACLCVEESSSLRILTATAAKKQSSEFIVGSINFLHLVEAASAQYACVVLDCPPIGYVVDAKIMSRYADLVIYVVKQNSATQRDVLSGLRQVVNGTRLTRTALVLNDVRELMAGRYHRPSRYNNYYKSPEEP